MGSGRLQGDLQALAGDLAAVRPPARAHLPADFAALCATVAEVEGVHFSEVFDRLAVRRVTGDALLQDVLTQVFDLVRQGSEGSEIPPSEPGLQASRWWPWRWPWRRRRRSQL